MEKILIKYAKDHVDKEVTLHGWLNNKRSSGKMHFLEVRDGTGYIQGVYMGKNDPVTEVIEKATQESAIKVQGTISKHPKKENVYELQLTGVEILSPSVDFPITKKEHGPDFLMKNRHLWLRSKKQWATLKIRDQLTKSIINFFDKEDFVRVDSPIITPVACEGTTTLFDIDYFDLGKGYLSQSGQLYLEASIYSHNRVYDFGPVFRAEKSNTRKHLIEFWMMDAEMAFFDHYDNMDFQERFFSALMKDVLEYCGPELSILERDTTALEKIVEGGFERISHAEIVKFLQKKGSTIGDNDDLGAQDETIIGEEFGKPVFIDKWPKDIKAFYMKRDPQNDNLVLGSDLIVPEGYGELFGGSQREDDYHILLERMKHENLPLESFEWYLDTRKYGSVPHSGFGIGLERMVSFASGSPHIRESIPFPRLLNRMTP